MLFRSNRIEVKIYQGDSFKASYNNLIGERFSLKVPKREKGLSSIWVTFTYDINGILDVKANSELEEHDQLVITNENLDERYIENKKLFLSTLREKDVKDPRIELVLNSLAVIHRNSDSEVQRKIENLTNEFDEMRSSNKPTMVLRRLEEMEEFVRENSISVFDREDNNFFN